MTHRRTAAKYTRNMMGGTHVYIDVIYLYSSKYLMAMRVCNGVGKELEGLHKRT